MEVFVIVEGQTEEKFIKLPTMEKECRHFRSWMNALRELSPFSDDALTAPTS